ncbi:GNAT family N-acetyltransferase [Kangiella koreensis]|uniref:GCN5-related N-acetyltransferase n=1 Tax=Kangiella koreensis (strain DSM 16069 / JCM 12317 / KCTC 12182 / SW-125) TaxID=523791 RepID=C7RC38_KANKD|nr:GNAT family N-acetyltransferase [Kangiella koreensis]ACV26830.1 GCN5-related N-acetyltransferase [Kangiella koreensis DSM 16069]
MLTIKSVPQATIIPLRHSVLRAGQPIESCYYEEDNREECFHLAALIDKQLVSIASFYLESHPNLDTAPKSGSDSAWRLRGMATDPEFQGKGYGAELLREGLRICREKGAQVLWCNARTTAAPFYSKLNFDIKGEEFVIEGIGPHYFMSYTFQ